jgi:hypothetical protein
MGLPVDPLSFLKDKSEAEIHEWLTTSMEVMRMMRDGDNNSNDDRASRIYRELTS